MTKPDFMRASQAALGLLKKYGYTSPPVDPQHLAECEGLSVSFADFKYPDSENVSGFFRLSDRTIVVNNDISGPRITFTIAHELAHYVLHQDFIRSHEYIPMPRNNEYPNGKPIEEIEADTFAANILVPLTMLKQYQRVASLKELARLFFVSEEVIANRLDLLRRFPSLAN